MERSYTYALIGAAGYVAPRHMKAIQETGGQLVAALDPHDSVGILDSYFPACKYFREPERFERHLEKLRRTGDGVDFVSICSPNYLHDAHIRMALRSGADAICEKPVVLNTRNLDALRSLEDETGRRVYPILQCRYHPAVDVAHRAIRQYQPKGAGGRHSVLVDYVAPRGCWYDYSWKGDYAKSGGVVVNIGVHLFDMLGYLFGRAEAIPPCFFGNTSRSAVGRIRYANADVQWSLSAFRNEEGGNKPRRVFEINGVSCDFSNGFTDLHTRCYEEILAGCGFSLADAREAIRVTEVIRNNG